MKGGGSPLFPAKGVSPRWPEVGGLTPFAGKWGLPPYFIMALSVFDLFLIALIRLEYRALKRCVR